MEAALDYWFLLPVGVLVAAVATSSGLAGSNFWIPIYLRGLDLEPRLVFWMSLVTMIFGFGSGVASHLAAGTVDWRLARRYGVLALPATAVAAAVAARLRQDLLLAAFAVFALVYGLALLAPSRRVRRRALPRLVAGIGGGLAHGAIATGAGAFMLPSMLAEERGRPASAVGASVLLIFVCTLVAVALRLDAGLVAVLRERGGDLAAMAAFAAPGVLIGGQLGPRLTRRLPPAALRPTVGALLLLVALLVATRLG